MLQLAAVVVEQLARLQPRPHLVPVRLSALVLQDAPQLRRVELRGTPICVPRGGVVVVVRTHIGLPPRLPTAVVSNAAYRRGTNGRNLYLRLWITMAGPGRRGPDSGAQRSRSLDVARRNVGYESRRSVGRTPASRGTSEGCKPAWLADGWSLGCARWTRRQRHQASPWRRDRTNHAKIRICPPVRPTSPRRTRRPPIVEGN